MPFKIWRANQYPKVQPTFSVVLPHLLLVRSNLCDMERFDIFLCSECYRGKIMIIEIEESRRKLREKEDKRG